MKFKFFSDPGILRDRNMDDKLICVSNDDKQNPPFMKINIIGGKVWTLLFEI